MNTIPPLTQAFDAECLQASVIHANSKRPITASISSPTALSQSGDWPEVKRDLASICQQQVNQFLAAQEFSSATLLQAAWVILLGRYSQETDVSFLIATNSTPAIPDDSLRSLNAQWSEPITALELLHTLHQQLNEPKATTTVTSDCLRLQLTPLEVNPANTLSIAWFTETEPTTLIAQYDHTQFQPETITRLLAHLEVILAAIAADSHQNIATLPLLTAPERQQLLHDWNQTQVDYPKDALVHHLFEAQVEGTPDAIALTYQNQHLTYQELNQRANQLAHHLISLGVEPDQLVGLCVERSLEMVMGLLGILKSGGAYVPLDPGYPPERLAYMLTDAQVTVLLTQERLVAKLPKTKAKVFCLDSADTLSLTSSQNQDNPNPPLNEEHLAYVIYTSGSTGKPKGVMVPHRALSNHMLWMQDAFPLNTTDKVLQKTPFSFDASVWEFYAPLLTGATLVMAKPGGHQDSDYLIETIQQAQITILQLVPSLLRALMSDRQFAQCQSLRRVFCGGEALTQDLRSDFQAQFSAALYNLYGPTETCIDATVWDCQEESNSAIVPIGRAIANLQTYVLDAHQQLVPQGITGELYIGGRGVARGYWRRPELTQARFLSDPFRDDLKAKLYRTGDLVRQRADGVLEFIGRADTQVKVRGYRVELGEIEAALAQHPGVQDVAVVADTTKLGNTRLMGYVTEKPMELLDVDDLQAFLNIQLADYMIPNTITLLETMPLSPSGKLDRLALPKSNTARRSTYVAPTTPIETTLTRIWNEVLGVDDVGVDDNFFDLGGTSISALHLVTQIREQLDTQLQSMSLYSQNPTIQALVQQRLGAKLRVVKFYQYPTIRALARYLTQGLIPQQQKSASGSGRRTPTTAQDGIAIIGMVGRFPGADTIEQLWDNLCAGRESITFFPKEAIDASVDPELRDDESYIPAKGILDGAETFDASFFGITPREAEIIDPQARVFLELAHEALETVGYTPERYSGQIGLYAGSGPNTYFEQHICGRPEIVNRLGAFPTQVATEKDYVTTRAAYKLNLTGPVMSIVTACSTSLVATIQACRALLNYECDTALAGGVSVTTPQNTGYLHLEGGMLSPDGRCRPFDANAQGTTFNNGAGIVVLKRLGEAIDDGDRIYAVIKGMGMNNDGADKVSFTAPSVNGQAKAIAMAQNMAGFSPETISYVEAHGTATPMGDPIEIEALTQAFRLQTEAKQFCAIGSIKSNIGHAVAAAGVAGLIKTALSLYHQKLPPSLGFDSPNPHIDFESSPFYVNSTLQNWPAEGETPRRAGVSSFGVGGTNAHVVLEAAPTLEPSSHSRPGQLLLLSAKTPTALTQAADNLQHYLQTHPETPLADIAATLQRGRKGFNHRQFWVCRDRADTLAMFAQPDPKRTGQRQTQQRNPEVVFMFPGQGSQYVDMGLNLYRTEPVFREALDRCVDCMTPLLQRDLRNILYPSLQSEHPTAAVLEQSASLLKQTQYTQPALFAVEYALAQLWLSWGIQPAALIGHSIGEFVAATISGVLSLEDAIMLVVRRGQMMWDLPAGSMLLVRSPAAEVAPRLSGESAIAAINGPTLCVASGPTPEMKALQQQLEAEEVVCRFLHTSHAFHSPMMDVVVEPFLEVVKTVPLSPLQIPFVSTVTADWITPDQALDPHYWASHLRATVRFTDGVQTLWQDPHRVLLEVGPRTTTATLARQQATDLKQQFAISSLGKTAEEDEEWVALLRAIGQLWLAGVEIDWSVFYRLEQRHRVPLPTYPFERQRYWIDPLPAASSAPTAAPVQAAPTFQAAPMQGAIAPPQTPAPVPVTPTPMPEVSTEELILPLLVDVLETTSGIDVAAADPTTTFLELGLDSLSLTQVALALKKKFKVKIAFRHLLEDYPNLETLTAFLAETAPPEVLPKPEPPAAPQVAAPPPVPANGASLPTNNGVPPAPVLPAQPLPISNNPADLSPVQALINQQLQVMSQQLQLLGGAGLPLPTVPNPTPAQPAPVQQVTAPQPNPTPPKATTATDSPKPTSKAPAPGAKIQKKQDTSLSDAQRQALDQLMTRYLQRTPESKRQAQEHRSYLADPRTVSGFTPLTKEMVYPLVVDRSQGARLWDVDGNEYIDLTSGFGLNFFGWNPDYVTEAVIAQMQKGIEIGPQTPLAGRVAKMITEFTGLDRVAFCNTGSEAVMATLRLSRTVTGNNLIATFAGDYHGTFDEVLYRQGAGQRTLPGAPGIMPEMFENLLVLDYDKPESLEILRDRADDLAGVMVEPVRSRDPGLQPREFLQELRRLTEKSESTLIFDEVVTGFRVAPGGAQEYFNIKADLATYGKVIGGGLPIGVVAGSAQYMDALDGGFWQYGDDSIPEVGVTFFAGTFVRHPMALAAAEASLLKLKAGGPNLQKSLAEKVQRLATTLTQYCDRVGAPIKIAYFSSFFYVTYDATAAPYGGLLFYLLRAKGIHIWEYRACFLTLAHTDADVETIMRAFKEAIAELQAMELLPGHSCNGVSPRPNQPPQPGARLGRDQNGNPSWFVPDLDRPGNYLQLSGV
ncbi:MAG: amino acid adenylation domain-containing protein [Spirulina sp. SIO3F2]|nr:amino acid adenylation domain-containing protein [Spirulina sp. SIO3F2]